LLQTVLEEGDFNVLRRPKFSGWLGADFFKLWLASSCSSLGDGVMLAAGPLLLASITSDPALVAGAVVVQQVPWVLFSLPAGAFIDRVDRKSLVVRVNLVRGAVLGGLAALVAFHLAVIAVVYAALLLLGVCEVLADNAYSTLVPMAVKKEDLPRANGRLGATFMIGNQFIGPALGAFIFTIAAEFPFAVDGFTYIVAMAFVFFLRQKYDVRQEQPAEAEKTSVLADIKDGLRWVRNARGIRVLAVTLSIMNITFMMAFSVLVLLARERLGLRGTGFGLLLAVSAAGGLAGASLVGRIREQLSLTVLLRLGILVEAGGLIVLGLARSPFLAGASMAVASFVSTVWGVSVISYRQSSVPRELQGRVTSVFYMAVLGSSALGALLGGFIATFTGVSRVFLIAGLADLVLSATIWRFLGSADLRAVQETSTDAQADSVPVLKGE
jgi:MFS family permease